MVIIFEEIDLPFPIKDVYLPSMLDKFCKRLIYSVLFGFEASNALCLVKEIWIDF